MLYGYILFFYIHILFLTTALAMTEPLPHSYVSKKILENSIKKNTDCIIIKRQSKAPCTAHQLGVPEVQVYDPNLTSAQLRFGAPWWLSLIWFNYGWRGFWLPKSWTFLPSVSPSSITTLLSQKIKTKACLHLRTGPDGGPEPEPIELYLNAFFAKLFHIYPHFSDEENRIEDLLLFLALDVPQSLYPGPAAFQAHTPTPEVLPSFGFSIALSLGTIM